MFYAHPHPSTCTTLSNIFSPANCKQRGAGYANIAWQDAATWSRTHRYDVTWCVNSVCTPSKSLYFSQTSTRWYLALLSRINTYKINDLFQNDTCFHSTPATSANQHYLLNVICAANESEILKAICTELLRHLISSAQWLIICSKWRWVFNQICLKEMGGKKCHHCVLEWSWVLASVKSGLCHIIKNQYISPQRGNELPEDNVVKLHFRNTVQKKMK